MNFEEFQESLAASTPPMGLSLYAEALWQDGKGAWEKAHELIQDLTDANAAWIHAYLHRKEGDNWNADYWYRKAGKKRPAASLETEWQDLVKAFL